MNEELDTLAAEFVLGTLPAHERSRFAERLTEDGEARAAVAYWERRLSPLDASAAATTPRAALWEAIERATAGATGVAEPAANDNVRRLSRRLAAWRGAAIASGALAAALAIVAVVDRTTAPTAPEGGHYVAVVNSDGAEPALIAEVDTKTGTITVRSLSARAPAGKSLELWHIAEGHQPRSLGVLKAGINDAQTIRDEIAAGPVDGVIAITVEPEGGSPSGAPTGPVVYSGKLIPVE